jgi:hypothetical protein
MKQISVSSIENSINKVDNLSDDGLEKIAETYALSQPTLLGYVMSAAQEYENERLEGLLVYYFCLISECFTQESIKLRTIEESDIETFEEPFFEMLDKYFDNDDQEIVDEFCDQPELFRFMISEISTADEDGTSLDDETATQLFIVTLAMMTLMSRVID